MARSGGAREQGVEEKNTGSQGAAKEETAAAAPGRRPTGMLRRRMLLAGAAQALLLPGGPAWAAKPVLRVLAWPGYADTDTVKAFEARHGVQVELTIVGSDDVLRARLADERGGGYDVVAANTVELAALRAQGALAALTPADIPHMARQLPRFRSAIPGIVHDGQVYAVPYTYSEMGLIYDRQQLSMAPSSLAALWDTRWQGKVLAFDGGSHGFALAAMAQGLPPFTIPEARFAELARRLVALRRNLLSFYALPEEAVELFRRHQVAVMHANYGQQQLKLLRDAGLDVGYVVPREGALAWLDCWAILRRSPQQALAARWIDHLLEPATSREFTRRQGLANTLEEPAALDAAHLLGPLAWLEPVEDSARRERLWRRIVAGDRLETF